MLKRGINPLALLAALLFLPGIPAYPGGDAEKGGAGGGEAPPPVLAPAGESPASGRPAAPVQPVPDGAPTISADMAFAVAAGNAERGDPTAMLALGSYYEQGIGVNRSFVKALEWYQQAADAGLGEAWYLVGVCYEVGIGNAGDILRAVRSYERAANLGLPEAMEKLSSLYFSGAGVERNESQGLAYLVQAADAGLASAANSLGGIYLEGLFGQRRDEQKAFAYFDRAAGGGDINAIINLGIMYREGLAVEKDQVRALQWFIIASRDQYQGGSMLTLVAELKNNLTAAQITEAEQGAEQWLRAYQERIRGL
jgi:TPR repeat protein